MKVYQILKQYTNLNSLDIECLVAKNIGENRTYVLSHPKRKVSFWQSWKIKKEVQKRAKGYPLHYLLGYKEFYSRNFFVNKYTLIPRPETEELVDILQGKWGQKKDLQIIDLGTGSGCLWLTLANVLPVKKVYLLDISKWALSIAKKNTDNLNLSAKVELKQSDLLLGFSQAKLEQTDLIVANLPYLSEDQMKTISVEVGHEPVLALVAGKDGLKYYRELLEQIRVMFKDKEFGEKSCTDNGMPYSNNNDGEARNSVPVLWIEFDPSQVRELWELCVEKGFGIEFYKDLSGRSRFGEIVLQKY